MAELAPPAHHPPARRPGRRRGSRRRTEAELIEAVTAADDAGEPLLVLAGGSNLVVADEGFPGTVVQVATRGVADDEPDDGPSCGGVTGHGRRRRGLGRPRRARRRRAAGSASRRSPASPARSAPPRSRTSAPTARRSPRPSRRVRVWDRKLTRRPHVRQRRLRLRLPAPAGSRPTPAGTSSSTVTFQFTQGDLGAPVRYAELAPRARRRAGRTGAAGRRPRGGARAAARQGHGARPRRPRHLERRLVLHQPGRRRAAARPRRTRRAGRSPTARVKTSAAWLIEHAGFGKGYGLTATAAGSASPPSTRSRSPTAAAPPPRTCWRWPARSATASSRVRDPAGQRAGPGRLRALSRRQSGRGQPPVDVGEHGGLARRRARARPGPTSGPARPAARR